MSQESKEIALLEEVVALPSAMQHIYLQIVSSIEDSLARLRCAGAEPEFISEEFIDSVVTVLLDQKITQQGLQDIIDQEFQMKILENTELATHC